jgi:hypothetical protein
MSFDQQILWSSTMITSMTMSMILVDEQEPGKPRTRSGFTNCFARLPACKVLLNTSCSFTDWLAPVAFQQCFPSGVIV